MKFNLLLFTFSLFLTTSLFSNIQANESVSVELPSKQALMQSFASFTQSDLADEDFETILAREEVLLNIYSQRVRGTIPLNTFYQLLVQWGTPKDFVEEIDEAYVLLENNEITIEEAKEYLEEVIERLNKAQKNSQVYSDLVDRVRFFLAVLPLVIIITE